MDTYKHREIVSTQFMGEQVDFIATNDRLQERAANLSHERHVLQTLIETTDPDDVFWDIGACLGVHSLVLAKHLPDGHVVSFEPMPANRGVLMDNKSMNELPNIRVDRRPLGKQKTTTTFAIRQSIEAGYGRHGLRTGEYELIDELTVDVVPGDTLVNNEHPLPNVIKIDVEGAGPLVLQGLDETLRRDACTDVILETHRPNDVQPSHEDFGFTREDIISYLEERGFSVETLEEEWHLHATKEDAGTQPDSELDIQLEKGDLATYGTDAVVNSAGTSLRMGTGVAGALRSNGGEHLNRAAIKQGPVDVGEVAVTDGYDLDASYVVHAASMPHYGDGRSTADSVRSAVRNALRAADERDCETIAIPAVGCGLGGLPLTTGAEIIFEELRSFNPTSLEKAIFVAYTDEEHHTIEGVR